MVTLGHILFSSEEGRSSFSDVWDFRDSQALVTASAEARDHSRDSFTER